MAAQPHHPQVRPYFVDKMFSTGPRKPRKVSREELGQSFRLTCLGIAISSAAVDQISDTIPPP